MCFAQETSQGFFSLKAEPLGWSIEMSDQITSSTLLTSTHWLVLARCYQASRQNTLTCGMVAVRQQDSIQWLMMSQKTLTDKSYIKSRFYAFSKKSEALTGSLSARSAELFQRS